MDNTRQHQYQQLYRDLKRQIHEGQFKKGDVLPSENELCRQYNTTRPTVRQALNELIREGYIYRMQGKGSIVQSEVRALGLLSFKGFSEVVQGAHHAVKTELLQPVAVGDWPATLRFPLTEADRQAGCLVLERLRYADDEPVMLEYTYVPNREGTHKITEEPLLDGSLFKTLNVRFGAEITHVEQYLWAAIASKETADLLHIKKNTPIIHIERRYTTTKKDFFVYSSLYCYTDKYALSNQFN